MDMGDRGVGSHGSTKAAEAWWARSWSSCSLSGDRNGRLSMRWVSVGVQVEVEEGLWEMVVNYNGDSHNKEVRPFVMVGLGRAQT